MGDFVKSKKIETVTGFQNNDETVLQKVYVEVYPRVLNHVLQNNGNEDQAKDIFQEAFIVCWKNIKTNKFSENGNVEGYLFTISKNKWTDYLRSARYKKTVPNNGIVEVHSPNEETWITDNEQKNSNALKIAMQKLGEGCKALLTQFYFERMSMDEIATELKIGSASVRNKKYRCMEKLRNLTLEIKSNG